ncbi:MAG: 50S ribosomal protein L29 [Cellvibrionales bacterium TMED148]|nr:50S ribosomal protein L29 [Porticoccaceae bacterium]RPG92110.1 MAG: 50S ribosomal protein L29 [Cellvibrionales bacterium TMED148]|tara:strand:+ start:87 stop:278 length:192 start_codon:yes stop_codon:yes gene_type:complete
MEVDELRKKTSDELLEALSIELKEQFKLRIQKSSGEFNQTHLIKLSRRNVAKIKTVMTEKAGG